MGSRQLISFRAWLASSLKLFLGFFCVAADLSCAVNRESWYPSNGHSTVAGGCDTHGLARAVSCQGNSAHDGLLCVCADQSLSVLESADIPRTHTLANENIKQADVLDMAIIKPKPQSAKKNHTGRKTKTCRGKKQKLHPASGVEKAPLDQHENRTSLSMNPRISRGIQWSAPETLGG